MAHKPVLLKESIEYLNPELADIILDATINGGGHAKAILEKIGKEGKLIGIEQDTIIFEKLELRIRNKELGDNLILINGNFRDLDKLVESAIGRTGINKKISINGAIFDLGMSSLQLEESGRGFSFKKDELLLMTYKSYLEPSDLTAKDIVNEWGEEEISNIIYKFGEERYSRRIAKNIIEERKKKSIETTFDLVRVIEMSVPPFYLHGRIHCATKTFQALRIAVNDEVETLENGIKKAWDLLEPGSRLVVISFHSLEDRIVKFFYKDLFLRGEGKILTKKPIIASKEEVESNSRSRSAKLRAIEKLL